MKTNQFLKRVVWMVIPLLTMFSTNVWGDKYTLVTSNSSLSNGDKVVIATISSNQPGDNGVTGWNGSNDATVSATAASWVQYTVSNASGSGWKLYDSSASKYIADPSSSNQFLYDNSGYTCSVNASGQLICHSRYMCKNGTNYRFYSSIGSYIPFYVWKVTAGSGGGCDILDKAFTGNPGSYTNWSNKSGSSSDAVYAGNSNGGNSSIQIRGSNNSGIVTTASGGTASSVTVTWNNSTQDGRTLNVYGKNTAYSAATDLYNNSNQGTLLGTIVKGTSTSLTITGSYTYIGLRSNSDAMYLTEVQICWGAASCAVDPTLGTPTLSGITSGTISVNCPSISAGTDCAIDDYGFVWVSGGSDPTISNNKTQKGTNNQSTAYSDNLSISFTTGTTYKIKAYAHNGHGNGLSTSSLTVIPQSISFNGNTSTSGSMSAQYVNRNTSTALTSNAFSKTGHTFAGWATSADGAVVYTNGQSVSIASNLNLYAKWTAKTTTVSFNQNSGTGGQTSSVTATYGSAMPTPITLPTRDGYTFAGYYESSGGTGTKYYDADGTSARTWDKENSTWTLYAKWTAGLYTVTWVVNGSTVRTDSNVEYGSSVTPPTVSPLPCGDKLAGWTDAEGGNYVYGTSTLYSGATIPVTGNVTLYAVFADYDD